MKPFKQLVSGRNGDCFRACVASLLEVEPASVPHFFEHGDAERGFANLDVWLLHTRDLSWIEFAWPGDVPLNDLLASLEDANPGTYYVIGGIGAGGGNHVVIARGGMIVHDPGWNNAGLRGPNSNGVWTVGILASALHK